MIVPVNVRKYLLAFLLLGLFFLFPFQIYLIGGGLGIGIEGAVYRFQITTYGNSFLPITSDIMYIINGIYSGRTALSIIIWCLGTILLSLTLVFALSFIDSTRPDYYQQITFGLCGTCVCYLMSCIAQYGFFLSGMAGISLPAGVLLVLFWIILLDTIPGFSSAITQYFPE